MTNSKIVVMGVSGSGKTKVGQALAEVLRVPFHDADDFHSKANVEKMSQGIPLTDQDRVEWLAELADLLQRRQGIVLACSALKAAYRQRLKRDNPEVVFIYLQGEFETILARLKLRQSHYFKGEAMLQSQFEVLEPPTEEEALVININQSFEQVLAECLAALDLQSC
ncbi:gluconokinase [Gynuella sunshinyii]|uniref:Gluconokinase n=1 Tax=Gynuella sunshinyii YC6258 TaxID=1445510 RepID=A0A0C5VSX9_9GAMM|nr:gluconokinase [Gynuella sunshinyii]AJQ97757.1 gluconate kinase [Gynuella sunshinyii YC6258]